MHMTNALFNGLHWWYHNRPQSVKDSPYVFVNTHGGPTHGQPFTFRRWFFGNIHSDLAGTMEQLSSGYDLSTFPEKSPLKSPLNEQEAKLLSLTS